MASQASVNQFFSFRPADGWYQAVLGIHIEIGDAMVIAA
jgi:hypothetical protein